MLNIVLFEDDKHTNLQPFSKTRPLHFLRCGARLLYEKYFAAFPDCSFHFWHRPEFDYMLKNLEKPYSDHIPDEQTPVIAINVRILPNEQLIEQINDLTGTLQTTVYGNDQEGLLLGYFATYAELKALLLDNKETTAIQNIDTTNLKILHYPWDLVNENGSEITADYHMQKKEQSSKMNYHFENAILINQNNMLIDESVTICPGVVIDATKGPVILAKNVTIMHNSVVIGPCYIGENSTIKIGAKIYENSSFGPYCKIGGEVEDSIVLGYSNKQHDGFLGHAYLGEWCNLGADTNNSDLKNNYSSVTVQINGKLVDSGSMFVGLFMGDHSKSAINTMFNTGTVVGVCCNIFGEGFPERNIPDFHWGGKGKTIKYPFKRTIETVAIVKARRKQQLQEAETHILKQIFDNSI